MPTSPTSTMPRVAAVRAALLEHKVLFFRDQSFGPAEHVAFARRLGELTGGHPTLPSEQGKENILELDSLLGGRADHWHTDVTFAVEPPAISVLRAVKLPPVGGDTQWASTEAAYQRLPEPLKRLAGDLHAVHTNAYDYGRALAVSTRHRRRAPAGTGNCSPRSRSRPSTRSCGCTPRRDALRCCWAASPSSSSGCRAMFRVIFCAFSPAM